MIGKIPFKIRYTASKADNIKNRWAASERNQIQYISFLLNAT